MRLGQSPAYLATAEALDDEMRVRVLTHKQQRATAFATIEEPIDLAEAIAVAGRQHDVILVDCLTLWISNLLGAEHDVTAAVGDLIEVLSALETTLVVLVSNEVGLGIVPDNALARLFRDLAGSSHQRLAAVCTDVYFVAAGLPIAMKGTLPAWD